MHKKIICLIFSLVLIIVGTSTAAFVNMATKDNNDFDLVGKKHQLKKIADCEYKKENLNTSKNLNLNLENTLFEISLNKQTKMNKIEKLRQQGIYSLNYTNEQSHKTTSDSSDIILTKPQILYNANSNTWMVVGGGYWIEDNWEVPWQAHFKFAGSTVNVGNPDGFGIRFTSTSGKLNAKVLKSCAYISDGEGHEIITNKLENDVGTNGFGFQLQDKIRIKSNSFKNRFSYIGKHFACLVKFDSSFADYDGVATTFYIHTYGKSKINHIPPDNINLGVDNFEDSFIAYSTDERF